ncbi:MAG TPA: hypothetical protein PKY25_01945 [Bacilli bacterium]|nr:hypothetical protein [Bacilli bacterium]
MKDKKEIAEDLEKRYFEIIKELSELSDSELRSFALNEKDARIVQMVLEYKGQRYKTKNINRLKTIKGIETELLKLKEILDELKSIPAVNSYIENMKKLSALKNKLQDIKDKNEEEKLFNCKHIWYIIKNDSVYGGDASDSRGKKYACMKCGYDSRESIYALSKVQRMFFNEFYDQINKGIKTDIFCEYSLAETYQEIVKDNPNITDEEIVKLVELRLANSTAYVKKPNKL